MRNRPNRKKRKVYLHPCMIAATMINPALVFAVMMLAAVKRDKWFSEISNLHGVRYLNS